MGCLTGLFLAFTAGADSSVTQKRCKERGLISLVLLFDRSKSMDIAAEQTFRAIQEALNKTEWARFPCDISYVARGFYAARPNEGDLPDGGTPTQRLDWFPALEGETGNSEAGAGFAVFNEQVDGGKEVFLQRVRAATRSAGTGLDRNNTPLAEAIRWAAQHSRPVNAQTGISIFMLATDGVPDFGVRARVPGKKDRVLKCSSHGVLVTDLRNAWVEARQKFSHIFVIDPTRAPDAGSGWFPGSDLDFLKSNATGVELASLPPPASVPKDCDGGVNLLPLNDMDPQGLRAEVSNYSAGRLGIVDELAGKFVTLLEQTCKRATECCDSEVCDGRDNDCDGETDELPCPSCEAVPAGFPEVVAVGRGGRYWCSGVVVAPHAVLTARHCLPADTVLSGESIHTAAELRRAVRVHLPAEPTADAAVLELAAPLKLRPPQWRHAGDVVPPTSVFSHVGFGASTPHGALGFGFKHALALDGRGWGCDREQALETGCDPSFEMFVPGSPGRDTCQGDSGGGLFELVFPVPACVEPVTRMLLPRRRLIGLTSRTTSSATVACGQGGIYTRIDQLAPWLDSLLKAIHQRHAVQGGNAE